MEVKRNITIECKIENLDVYPILDFYSSKYGFLMMKLYNILFNKQKSELTPDFMNTLQRKFISEYGIKARNFKSLFIDVKGRIKSQEELDKLRKSELKRKINKQEKKVNSWKKRLKGKTKINNWYMKSSSERKLNSLNQKLKTNRLKPIIFGTKELFNSQFHSLLGSHDKWLDQWRDSRSNHIYFVGSSCESFGNSLCQIHSSILCRLTLPNSVVKEMNLSVKHLNLNINLNSRIKGRDSESKRKRQKKKQERYDWIQEAIKEKRPITTRIIKRNGIYYLQVSIPQYKEVNEKTHYGAVGYDLNHGFINYCMVKPDGNAERKNFFKEKYDPKSSTEVQENQLSNIAKKINVLAKENKCIIVRENLDLERSKENSKCAFINKKIHSVPTDKFTSLIESKAFVNGTYVKSVHPAYTSISAKLKYSPSMGRSVHDCAALTIARRGLGFRERVPFSVFSLVSREERSVKIRKKHNWSQWHFVNKNGIGFLKRKSPHVLQSVRKVHGDDLSNARSSLFSIQNENHPDKEINVPCFSLNL